MATRPSTNWKSTRKTSAKSSAARAASSVVSAPSSKPPPPAKAPASTSTSSDDDNLLVVAQILAPHAIRGELKCRIVTDFPKQRFKRGNVVIIDGEEHIVQAGRIQGQIVLLKLAEV